MCGNTTSSSPIPEAAAWRGPLLREATRLGLDPDEAEDLVQECLLVMHAQGTTVRDPARLLPWCRVVLRNLLRQRRRRRWYSEVLGLDSLPEPACDPWEAVDARLTVEGGLGRLPAQKAEAVRSFYLGGQSIAAISRDQGRPEGTIKRWLHESREVLRMTLAEGESERPTACLYASGWMDDALRSVTTAVEAAGLSARAWELPGEEFVPPAACKLFVLGEHQGARTGLELLLCLRATEETRQIPVLLFGPGRHSAILAAWQAGADAYLTDPSSPDVAGLVKQLVATGRG